MTTEQLNIILKHLYEKNDTTIILSNGSHICFNPQIACPYIEDNLLHLEGEFWVWIEVKDIISVFDFNINNTSHKYSNISLDYQ